jgi:hypothetical protein
MRNSDKITGKSLPDRRNFWDIARDIGWFGKNGDTNTGASLEL